MPSDRVYYRPIPQSEGGRWRLADGWTGFSSFERLQRGHDPVVTDTAPAEIIDKLTSARAPLMNLPLDRPRLMGTGRWTWARHWRRSATGCPPTWW